jgi:hypothetical protein
MPKKMTLLVFLWITIVGFAQPKRLQLSHKAKNTTLTNPKKPVYKKADFFRISPPLIKMIQNAKAASHHEKELKKNEANEWHPPVINNGLNAPDPLSHNQNYTRNTQVVDLNKLIDFDGVDNIDGVAPPDTQGDVNDTYYIQCVNNHSVIKDRAGNDVVAAFPTSDFWQGTPYSDRNDGDAVILWDENAQRWLITQFYIPDNGDQYLLIAVSETDDPTGQYYQYGFNYGSSTMPDYPKWAIWPDAYYMGANGFDPTDNYSYVGAIVSAFERDKILQGDPNAGVVTFGPDINLWSVFPADADAFPANGTDCPFVSDNVDNTTGNNEVYIYNFHVDWTNTANSTFGLNTTLNVADYNLFSSGTEVPQPGVSQKLDLLHYRIMYRPYYRHFNDHESLLMTRTVNDGGVAAIRWYEFRDTGNGWEVYQQGTYSPGDGIWRWMPSIAMNQNGDISIAYSVSDDNNKYPSIRAVARYSDDPLGEMPNNEIELYTGNASQDNVSRWGDYAMVSVDPDGKTFWFTSEYTTGNWDWRTRIIHYELPSQCDYPADQASNVTAQTQSQNQIDLSWTRGSGDKVIVLAKESAAVNTNPADGTNYNANATFGSGDEIGTGNYVVYVGTGDSVSITGLSASTEYYFAVYEFNSTNNCYLTPAATASAKTYGPPQVATLSMLQVNDTDAQGQGEVLSENGSPVTERGLCWSTVSNPTISDDHASNGTGTGTYTVSLTGLTINTTYYVRAYATNAYGTSYGENKTFRTGCNIISDFPYLENFDAWTVSNPTTDCTADASVTFEDCWENLAGDDNDWDIFSGATPSSGTGPSDDANGGGNYIYLEASNCFNKTASILTPHYDFTNLSKPYLSFFAHMYGADMGSLDVYYSVDNGQSWTLIGGLSGDYGDQWFKAYAELDGLAGETDVQFKLTGITGNGDASDIAIDNFVIKNNDATTYCVSEGNMDYNTAITRVIFNQIDNPSGGKAYPYEDYTYIKTVVQRNQSYDLTVNVDTDGNYTVYVKAWIDWNQDGDFDDADEELDLGTVKNVSDGATTNSPLSITIPATAQIGDTRMRVSAKYNDYATACETDFDGEVEDYTVTVNDVCNDVAYWNGSKWEDVNGQNVAIPDLSDKLLNINDVFVTNGQSIEACGLKVNSGNAVTINSGDYIKLTNYIYNEGKIDIENKGILVQSDNAAVVEGNGIFKMTVESQYFNNQYDYAYWSIPITNFNLGDIVADAWRYYSFEAGAQEWQFETSGNSMSVGRGYAISASNGYSGGKLKVDFYKPGEKFNTGAIQTSVSITGTGAQDDDDWNLIGNPYPSPIDFDTFANENTNVQGAYYLWTDCAGLDTNGQHQASGYTTYSVGAGSTAACSGNGASATQFVPAAEGIFVEANANASVTFNNSQRATTQTDFVNRIVYDRLWLDFENDTSFQQILIGFFQNATNGFDRLYDAHNINTTDFSFYSLAGQDKLVIQGLPAWQSNTKVIPLGFVTNTAGNYQIKINKTEGVLNNINIFLHDLYTNSLIDLKQQNYSFNTNEGRFEDRFELIFEPDSLDNIEETTLNGVRLLSGNKVYSVISKSPNIKTLNVYGIDDKLIYTTSVKQSVKKLTANLKTLPHQVLLFKVILDTGQSVILKGLN